MAEPWVMLQIRISPDDYIKLKEMATEKGMSKVTKLLQKLIQDTIHGKA